MEYYYTSNSSKGNCGACGKYRKLKTYQRKFDYKEVRICHECTKRVDELFKKRGTNLVSTFLDKDQPIYDIIKELEKFPTDSYIECDIDNVAIYVCYEKLETDEELESRLQRDEKLLTEWVKKQKKAELVKELNEEKCHLIGKLNDIENKINASK